MLGICLALYLPIVAHSACDPPPAGLVSWWPGNADADDIFGQNSGVFVGPVFGPGEVGQAFDLTGTNYVSIQPSSTLDVGQGPGFTIETWINPATLSGGLPVFEWPVPNAYAVLFWINVDASGTLYADIVDTGDNNHIFESASGVLTANVYQHVALTYDKASGVAQLLLNGAVVQESTLGSFTPLTSSGANIGYRPPTSPFGPAYFVGLIDEVSLYSRALSVSEIHAIYSAGVSGKCLTPVTPQVFYQPASALVAAGTSVSFTAGVSGSAPLSYQWQVNGTNLQNATNVSLVLSNVQSSSSGNYSLVITNPLGSTTSSNAVLQVEVVFAYGNGGLLTNTSYSFDGSVTVQLRNAYTNGSIFYTLDGSQPGFSSAEYSSSLVLRDSVVLRAIGYSADFSKSGELAPITILVIPIYSLSTATAGGGTISVSPSPGPYVSNSVVTVTATPASGWTFLQWLGDASGTNPTVNITMNRDQAVQAVFGTMLSTTVAGAGSIVLNPPGGLYPYGTLVRLSAVPQPGNYFGAWGNAASGNVNPLSFVVTSPNATVSSVFSPVSAGQAALTVVPVGNGQVGVSPRANVYSLGQNVSISALPATGQVFLGWSGDASGSQNPLMVSMNTNKVIYGRFSQNPTLNVHSPYDGLKPSGFQFAISGVYGAHYRVDGSTDLAQWAALGVVTNVFGTVEFNDTGALGAPYRFYRAVVVP
jgi:hypothetical protein